jgi:heterotetrameric sarcosine oxidase gamma subunit
LSVDISGVSALTRFRSGPGPAVVQTDALTIGELPFPTLLRLRGAADDPVFRDAIETEFGSAPPSVGAITGRDITLLWLAPTDWLVLGSFDADPVLARLATAFAGRHAAALDASDGSVVIHVLGPGAPDLIRQGSGVPLDTALRPGGCARTRFAGLPVTLYRPRDTGAIRLISERATAVYLWSWLIEAAKP